MSKISIDNREYDPEQLSAEAKQQLSAIQLIDAEIRNLQIRLSIANSAKIYHSQLLNQTLPKDDPLTGDTIRFG